MQKQIAGLLGLALLSACASDLPRDTARDTARPVDAPPSAVAPPGRVSANQLDTNVEGLAIIKESEGLRLRAYELGDSMFIGYGHLMARNEPETITEAKADEFLRADLGYCEQSLERNLTVPVTSNEFSALAGLCYNIGVGNMKASSVLRELNAGNRQAAADAFLLWNKAGGQVSSHLSTRRQAERALFLKP
jgi:GH24 family phage-related lysozyme (muramidase)